MIFFCEIFFTRLFFLKVDISEKNIFLGNFSEKKYFFPKTIFEKIFFGKVDFFFEHQGRSKISLRIEWDHSQPLRTTLNGVIPNIVQIFLIALNAICLFKSVAHLRVISESSDMDLACFGFLRGKIKHFLCRTPKTPCDML